MSWILRNVEAEGMRNLPTLPERECVVPGDAVKCGFGPDGVGERMWVRIQRVTTEGDKRQYRGILCNEPITIPELHKGDEIVLGPEHIMDIYEE